MFKRLVSLIFTALHYVAYNRRGPTYYKDIMKKMVNDARARHRFINKMIETEAEHE